MKPCLLYLTCANDDEANLISQTLLSKKMVVCIKKSKIKSSFLWNGKIDKSDETLLIMDSIEEMFDRIEAEVKKVHSYKTFVLLALPIIKSSSGIEAWMKSELNVK